jgi:hypothetical protein
MMVAFSGLLCRLLWTEASSLTTRPKNCFRHGGTDWPTNCVGSINMKKTIFFLIFIAFLVFGKCWAAKVEIPTFVPEYYS